MGQTTNIAWCDSTWNPWRGCTKVSAGCANCYAERQAKRNPDVLGRWGDHGSRPIAAESTWRQPLKWNREAEKAGVRRRVFCGSMMDFFEDRTDLVDARVRAFDLIRQTQNLDWLILTKRPQNWAKVLRDTIDRMRDRGETIVPSLPNKYDWTYHTPSFVNGWMHGDYPGAGHIVPPNIWLGTSCSTQADLDRNLPHLLRCPAKVRFLSLEPLVGSIDIEAAFDRWINAMEGTVTADIPRLKDFLHWVIVGGESGPGARPCSVEWIRSIVSQCREAGVPCFVKQLGAKSVFPPFWRHDSETVGKWFEPLVGDDFDTHHITGKGGDPEEWPEDLRVQEMPKVTRWPQ